MINEKLKATKQKWSQRQTGSTTHNVANVGIHLDEDNALVNSLEEDEISYISFGQ